MSVRQRKNLHCSFCSKSQRDVRKLIAGPGVYICDACTVLCIEIICEKGYELPPSKVGGVVALAFLGGDQNLGLLMHNTVDPEQLRLKDVIEHIVTEGERFTELKRIARHQALIKELDELEQNLRDPDWPHTSPDDEIAATNRRKHLERAEELRKQAHTLLQEMQNPKHEEGSENIGDQEDAPEVNLEDCLHQIPPPPPDDEDQP